MHQNIFKTFPGINAEQIRRWPIWANLGWISFLGNSIGLTVTLGLSHTMNNTISLLVFSQIKLRQSQLHWVWLILAGLPNWE